MQKWNVIYRDAKHGPLDFAVFNCYAEDMDQADDQCEAAYPGCDVLWADTDNDPEETIKKWLNCSLENDYE